MKLYVSDLDGTLLNSHKKVSYNSKKILNDLIDKGIKFTVATARTPGTVIDLLEGINLNIPLVLMNGVILYDIKEKKYISFKAISNDIVKEIINIARESKKNMFMYSIEEDNLVVNYENLKLKFDESYYNERVASKYKSFRCINSYEKIAERGTIINIVIMDTLEIVKDIYEKLNKISGIYVNYSQDIYDEECYFLEIHSDLASKANGINELSKYVEADEIICFGDNTNDISMFKTSNRAYAMSNAVEELKNIATAVIKSNNEDAVAEFIKNEN